MSINPKMNPKLIMQLKERLDLFHTQHPRFGAFLNSIGAEGVKEGSIVELKITDPDGSTRVTNIRLTADDVETLHMAESLRS